MYTNVYFWFSAVTSQNFYCYADTLLHKFLGSYLFILSWFFHWISLFNLIKRYLKVYSIQRIGFNLFFSYEFFVLTHVAQCGTLKLILKKYCAKRVKIPSASGLYFSVFSMNMVINRVNIKMKSKYKEKGDRKISVYVHSSWSTNTNKMSFITKNI